jgi:hypothetical protein
VRTCDVTVRVPKLLTQLALAETLRHLVVTTDDLLEALEAAVNGSDPRRRQLAKRWLALAQRFAQTLPVTSQSTHVSFCK